MTTAVARPVKSSTIRCSTGGRRAADRLEQAVGDRPLGRVLDRLPSARGPRRGARRGRRSRSAAAGRRGRSGCRARPAAARSSGRRLKGTKAVSSSRAAPCSARCVRSAPLSAVTTTSLTVAPAAWPASLTGASGIGRDQVARCATPSAPLSGEAGSAAPTSCLARTSASSRAVAARSTSSPGMLRDLDRLVDDRAGRVARQRQALADRREQRAERAAAARCPRPAARRRCRPASSSVSESRTRASAMPSAMQWCIRVTTAAPSPKPSTKWNCQSGFEGSSGSAIRSAISSSSAA